MSQNRIPILGPDGAPFAVESPRNGTANGHAPSFAFRTAHDDPTSLRLKAFGEIPEYLQSLNASDQPSQVRARQPFRHHAWVAAAAYAIATAASQAPFRVFRETDTELTRRRDRALKRYDRTDWKPSRGKSRRAFQKHLDLSGERRCRSKALEPDFDHPFMSVLGRPNPFMSASDLTLMTMLWLAIRGEVFWLKTDENGIPSGRAEGFPAQLWPLSPDCFEEVYEHGNHGEVVGWTLSPPPYLRQSAGRLRIPLALDDVVHMKLPNPIHPVRGMSRISAAAITVESDLLARTYNRSLLRNGGRLGGILTHPEVTDERAEQELARKLQGQHGGEHNAGRTKVLTGGWVWQPVNMSLVDLQLIDLMKWNRTEILAIMGVPDSVLGVSEAQTYATQLGQDRNFLEKTVLPMMRIVENAADGGLFFLEGDDVLAGFDLRDVESLRAGIDEKIAMAERLCGDRLHVPPRVAFETVGLEVEAYEGDDVALAAYALAPVAEVIEGCCDPHEPPVTDGGDEELDDDDPAPDPPSDADPAEEERPETERARNGLTASKRREIARKYRRKGARERRWREFVEVEARSEGRMRRAYRSWVESEREATLTRFDAAVGDTRSLRAVPGGMILKEDIDLRAILPELQDSSNALRSVSRPTYVRTLESIYTFTVGGDLGGIAVFEIDDPRFLDFFETRQRIFAGRVTENVFRNLQATLGQAISGAETIQQMRARIGEVYDIASSSSKTLTVARTETAGFMNGARNVMFEAGGFPAKDWVPAGDENTRTDHIVFGEAGPKPRDFDYMTLASMQEPGRLLHPHDPEAPASQVINCRCLELPAMEAES